MVKINEKKIFLRFIKERNIYCKCKGFLTICNNKGYRIYDSFDRFLSWHNSYEGYKFWYFTQLDFIKILMISGLYDENCISYYAKLLKGYNHERFINDKIWISHYDFYKTYFDNYRCDIN